MHLVRRSLPRLTLREELCLAALTTLVRRQMERFMVRRKSTVGTRRLSPWYRLLIGR